MPLLSRSHPFRWDTSSSCSCSCSSPWIRRSSILLIILRLPTGRSLRTLLLLPGAHLRGYGHVPGLFDRRQLPPLRRYARHRCVRQLRLKELDARLQIRRLLQRRLLLSRLEIQRLWILLLVVAILPLIAAFLQLLLLLLLVILVAFM